MLILAVARLRHSCMERTIQPQATSCTGLCVQRRATCCGSRCDGQRQNALGLLLCSTMALILLPCELLHPPPLDSHSSSPCLPQSALCICAHTDTCLRACCDRRLAGLMLQTGYSIAWVRPGPAPHPVQVTSRSLSQSSTCQVGTACSLTPPGIVPGGPISPCCADAAADLPCHSHFH